MKSFAGVVLTVFLPLTAFSQSEGLDGETFLEKFIAEKPGAMTGDLKDFASELSLHKGLRGPERLRIPDGRSLQKDHASFAQPRRIFGVEYEDSAQTTLPPPLFFGHAHEGSQIEAITWNPKRRRYEFILIKDFAPGKKPKLEAADRALCKTCHQDGGPIFTHFPWNETTNNPPLRAKLEEAAVREAREGVRRIWLQEGLPEDSFERDFPKPPSSGFGSSVESSLRRLSRTGAVLKGDAVPDFEVKFMERVRLEIPDHDGILSGSIQNEGSAFTFDAMVRVANLRQRAIRTCDSLCGNDLICRKYLLVLGAMDNHPGFGVRLKSRLDQEFGKLISEKLKKNNLGAPSSVLPDRNPLLSPEKGGVSQLFTTANPADHPFANDEVQPEARKLLLPTPERVIIQNFLKTSRDVSYIEQRTNTSPARAPDLVDRRVYGIRDFADPKTPRPLVGAVDSEHAATLLSINMASCFGFKREDLDELSSMTADRIAESVLGSSSLGAALEPWPPSRERAMAAIRSAVNDSYHGEVHTGVDCPMPEMHEALPSSQRNLVEKTQLALVKKSEEDKNKILGHFQKHCSSCHGGGSALKLPLDQLSLLKNYRSHAGKRLIDRLKNKEMPPPGAPSMPSADERKAMVELLSE